MRFAYARTGGPLLNWSGPTPPSPTRAGETRSLGDWYPTQARSGALRRYGGRIASPSGAAIGYEHNRQLGSLDVPRPGAPEVVAGYEAPMPGASTIHLGGYMPEGAARAYGQTMLAADEAKPPMLSSSMIRKGAALASVYHGMKRNNGSIMWGLLWGLAAMIAPVNGLIVPVIGAVQGFGQPRAKQNPSPRRKRKTRRKAARRKLLARKRRAGRRARDRRDDVILATGPHAGKPWYWAFQ